MRKSATTRSLLAVLAMAPLAGCAAPTEGGENVDHTSPNESALLADNAVTLQAADIANADIEDDRIVFPASAKDALLDVQAGHTIAGAAQDRAFLRRVTGIAKDADGNVVVTTQKIGLAGLVKHLSMQKHLTLPTVSADASGTVLAGDARANIQCSDCSIKYTPTLDLALAVDNGQVSSFRAEFDGDIVGRLALAATADGTTTLQKEIEVAHFTTRLVQTIGVVPVWEDITISVKAGASATFGAKAKIETGVTATKRMHGGVVFDGANWSTISDGDVTFAAEAPTLTIDVGANAAVYLKPEIDVKLYSLAGPYLAAAAELDLDAQVCPHPAEYDAKAAFVLSAGASLDFVNLVHLSVDKELYRKEWPLTSGALPVPPAACGK